MKTKILTLFILCITLILGCTKEESLLETPDDLMLKKASQAMVIKVMPNGVDDTQALIDAFEEAMAEGPGTIVQLCEGTYYINLIEVLEFEGRLQGVGKGNTIITTVPDLNVDDFLNQNLNTVLLSFVGGDVCVSDLTISTPQGPLSTGMQGFIHGQLGFCSITAQYVSQNECVRARVNNVEFVTQGNVRNGLLAESNFWQVAPESKPLRDINLYVTNCSFSGPYWWGYGILAQDIRAGEVVVGDKGKGNSFNNCDLGIWHNVSVKSNVYGNTFVGQNRWFAIQIVNGRWWTQMRHEQVFQSITNVEHNTFDLVNTNGILINDVRRREFRNDIPMLAQVKSNEIHTEQGSFTALGCLHLSNAVIRNNTLSGSALWGLRFFSAFPEVICDNGLVLGNDFSEADYENASILLGNFTHGWTVVGENDMINFIDVGENNRFSGVNNMSYEIPFGQMIVDNLQEMKGPMHNMMTK